MGYHGFDSILVRLKARQLLGIGYTFQGFDSILVRLKDGMPDAQADGTRVFRFHTGSIKSSRCMAYRRHRTCFDSILVRLKVCSTTANPTGSGASFDSILVRLKDSGNRQYRLRFEEFRFHTGSIKSRHSRQSHFRVGVSIPYWFD